MFGKSESGPYVLLVCTITNTCRSTSTSACNVHGRARCQTHLFTVAPKTQGIRTTSILRRMNKQIGAEHNDQPQLIPGE